MAAIIDGKSKDFQYMILNDEKVHLYLTKEELSDPSKNWIPYSYFIEKDSLVLMSPHGEEASYQKID